MRVTLLGTGGSAGVPMIGGVDGRGDWGVCDPAEPCNRRTRAVITIDGGAGFNTLDYRAYTTPASVDLGTGAATGVTGGVRNIENVLGGSGNDVLTGSTADNLLHGGAGDQRRGRAVGAMAVVVATGAGVA